MQPAADVMRRWRIPIWLMSAMAFGPPLSASARQVPAPDGPGAALRVFLDCGECDADYQRQQVTFVDYVRDRAAADLHVLVTTQATGGGGSAWEVKFIGLGRFQNQDRTFTFTTPQRATTDDRRKEFGRVFRIGLAGYAAVTPMAQHLDVAFQSQLPAAVSRDRWNAWTFRIGGTGNVSGEQSSTTRSYRFFMSNSRTTADWKINLTADGTADMRTFRVGNDRTIESRRDSWTISTLVVKSLGGNAGAGIRASMGRSSFSNTDRSAGVAPGIEYDFFPYTQANRRSLTVQYTFGTTAYEYREITIFDKIRENVPTHGLNLSLGLRAPWGVLGVYSGVSQQLQHRDRYHASLSANTEVSMFKGLSFNVLAAYNKINDQISLKKGTASTDEILLRQRQLATSHNYSFSLGVNYSFGSIFNTVVNPRFGGSAGSLVY
jgi:hypothetical protein